MTTIPSGEAKVKDIARRFSGVSRLFGHEAAKRFSVTPIVVVGLGGVGSWAAEAMVRSGCGRLTLVDLDHVSESNTNRQLHAVESTYGMAKVEAMAKRLHDINPDVELRLIDDFVTPENVDQCLSGAVFVLECTDQVVAKIAMAAWAREHEVALVMSGAAGGKRDPTRLRSGDLALASGDPLLAKVRHQLRKHHGFPAAVPKGACASFDLAAVWSDEPIVMPRVPIGGPNVDEGDVHRAARQAVVMADVREVASGLSCAGYGSAVTVTAPMGFAMAACALEQLAAMRP